MSVLGWKLDRRERDALLARFPPDFVRIVADHVTLRHGPPEDAALPGPVQARIIGESTDGEGVQAMVVEIDGTTDRPDGSTYHITWSLGAGRAAKESNHVIRTHGWRPVEPVAITLTPARF